jgi:hypothetical protein
MILIESNFVWSLSSWTNMLSGLISACTRFLLWRVSRAYAILTMKFANTALSLSITL